MGKELQILDTESRSVTTVATAPDECCGTSAPQLGVVALPGEGFVAVMTKGYYDHQLVRYSKKTNSFEAIPLTK